MSLLATEKTEPGIETVLWSGARSHWFYFGHWILGLLLAAGSAAAVYYNQDTLPQWAYAAPAVILLIVAAIVAWDRAYYRYKVTSDRVILYTGRFVRDSNEIRVQDIRSVTVAKHGLRGFLGVGTIEFSSAATDDAEVTFFGISGADHVRDIVRQLQHVEAP
jgi:membrane protein YdbS with pleckstrin-like domain